MNSNILILIKQAFLISVSISTLILIPSSLFAEYQYPSFYREPTGSMVKADHFANAFCGQIQDGIDGPSLQTVQGKNAFMASDRYGNYYFCDMHTNQVWWRDTAGIIRVIAGTGEHGFSDGPAGQAQFYFWAGGYLTYNNIKCDDSGRIYIADGANQRIRKIYRNADGDWWVSTISGGGTKVPVKGDTINALTAKYGCANEFGILPDGSAAYYAVAGGLYKVQINHQVPESSTITIICDSIDNYTPRPDWSPFETWKSGAMMSPDSVFIWSPNDPSAFFRFDEKTGKSDLYAGTQYHKEGYDSTGWRLDARWHTHIWVASPSGRAIFSGSGDDLAIRRIWQDTVKHLLEDGSYLIKNCVGEHCGYNASVLNVDFKGHLLYLYGIQSMFSNVIGRMTFENTDTTDTWESLPSSIAQSPPSDVSGNLGLFVFPNPFNPATLLHYNLGISKQNTVSAALTVYRCNGEKVRRFSLEEAEGDVIWHGDDETGKAVAAGHYLVALTMGNKRLVQRAVLVK